MGNVQGTPLGHLRRRRSQSLHCVLVLWYATPSYLKRNAIKNLSAKGLINNVLYVIILSAALDLVGPSVPKGVVLLADIIPSFLVKLCAPYFIHVVPYPIRTILMAAISTTGMLLIALTPPNTIGTKMSGVALASFSSGFGELSFLSLTHYYGQFSLAAWGSGTGGAGLIGAGAYVFLTSVGFGVRNTLLVSSLLPIILLFNFFVVLPLGPMRRATKQDEDYAPVPSDDVDQGLEHPSMEPAGPLRQTYSRRSSHSSSRAKYPKTWQTLFLRNLRRSRRLFLP